jgi:hypothetical protein
MPVMDAKAFEAKSNEIRYRLERRLEKFLTDEQWSALAYAAYERGHYAGYEEILSILDDLEELAYTLLK